MEYPIQWLLITVAYRTALVGTELFHWNAKIWQRWDEVSSNRCPGSTEHSAAEGNPLELWSRKAITWNICAVHTTREFEFVVLQWWSERMGHRSADIHGAYILLFVERLLITFERMKLSSPQLKCCLFYIKNLLFFFFFSTKYYD